MGGAHAVGRFAARLRAEQPGVRLLGLCDQREEPVFRRALEDVFVCSRDLEEELIKAVGPAEVEMLIERLGELGAWRSFQRQPAQRQRPVDAQLRRFVGTHSGRKAVYARALVEACPPERVPPPLAELLAHIG
jgi:hypothetical protein